MGLSRHFSMSSGAPGPLFPVPGKGPGPLARGNRAQTAPARLAAAPAQAPGSASSPASASAQAHAQGPTQAGGRRAPWVFWLVALVFLCLVGLRLVEATHLHLSDALERDCPVCQMAGQPALDAPPPLPTTALAFLFLCYCLPPLPRPGRRESFLLLRPHPRGPPAGAEESEAGSDH